MAQILELTESALLERLPCPLRTSVKTRIEDSVVLPCAEATAEWVIRESFEGRGVPFRRCLEVFDAHWKQTPFYLSKAQLNAEFYSRQALIGGECAVDSVTLSPNTRSSNLSKRMTS
jgi:hypothetical protein